MENIMILSSRSEQPKFNQEEPPGKLKLRDNLENKWPLPFKCQGPREQRNVDTYKDGYTAFAPG